MPLILYQVGDAPLFFNLLGRGDSSVTVDLDREWINPTAELIGTGGAVSYNDPLRPTPAPSKLQVKGSFVCDDEDSFASFTRLMSLGGVKNIPIIALQYTECIHDDLSICCSTCNTDLTWLVTYGTITQIRNRSEHLSRRAPWTYSILDLDMVIDVGTSWRVLSPWEWEYRTSRVPNPLSSSVIPETSNNIFILPSKIAGIAKRGLFYRWGLSLSQYTPSFWGLKYTDGRYGGYGSDFVDVGDYSFDSDPLVWSAPPNSVYAFSQFSVLSSGIININITRPYGMSIFDSTTEVTSININQLNTDLISGGYGGLRYDDVLVTGYARPYPGFIIRDAEIISDVRPKVSYTGVYPGETGIGYNRVVFSGDEINYKVGFVHDFGVY